jgi:hypothetical protein
VFNPKRNRLFSALLFIYGAVGKHKKSELLKINGNKRNLQNIKRRFEKPEF